MLEAPSCESQGSCRTPLSTNAAYNYDSVAYKYDAYEYDYSAPEPKKQPKRRVDVIPGGAHGRSTEQSPAHQLAVKAAKVTVAAVILFAGIGFARISFSAATVAEALEAREINTHLEAARSTINDLEVKQSSLSNPARIKTAAAELGMASPATTTVIDISGDIVVTDEKGNLSLSDSIKALESAGSEG